MTPRQDGEASFYGSNGYSSLLVFLRTLGSNGENKSGYYPPTETAPTHDQYATLSAIRDATDASAIRPAPSKLQ